MPGEIARGSMWDSTMKPLPAAIAAVDLKAEKHNRTKLEGNEHFIRSTVHEACDHGYCKRSEGASI